MKRKPFYNCSVIDKETSYIRETVNVLRRFHGGSRVTVTPPVTDTDDDYVLLIEDYRDEAFRQSIENVMTANGWTLGGSKALNNSGFNKFQSWKKGDLNIILTRDEEWFNKMRCATLLCIELNLKEKSQRIRVFEAVVYGKEP